MEYYFDPRRISGLVLHQYLTITSVYRLLNVSFCAIPRIVQSESCTQPDRPKMQSSPKCGKHQKLQLLQILRLSSILSFPVKTTDKVLGLETLTLTHLLTRKRNLVAAKAISFLEDARVVHSLSLTQQSVWLQWAEITAPFDFTWKNIIWGGISPEVVKFILNASVNWVRTPVLMKLWGYKQECSCCL